VFSWFGISLAHLSVVDSCGGGIAFWAVGYAFAYGGDEQGGPKTFVGTMDFLLMNDITNWAFWFFQFTFACAVSSIVAGTVAERCKMTAYLFYSFFLVGFVYPVVSMRRRWYFVLFQKGANDRDLFFLRIGRSCVLVLQWLAVSLSNGSDLWIRRH
jgi:ammonia channel protein AmtB